MRNLARAALLTLALLLCAVVPTGATPARANCKAVEARQRVALTGPTTTAGVITNNGLLKGTTAFTFTTGPTPTAEPAVSFYAGDLTITTDRGTLTTRDVGLLDTARGVFTDVGRVTGGTGVFAGATGTLFFNGTTADGATFAVAIAGELCLAR